MVQIFEARHGLIEYSSANEDWAASLAAENVVFTGSATSCKDCSLEFPETAVEQITLMGNAQQLVGTTTLVSGGSAGAVGGYFQNAMLEQKAATNWKFSSTVVAQGDEEFFHVIGLDSGSAIVGGFTRYSLGNLTSTGAVAKALNGSLKLLLDNGSERLTGIMTNISVTKLSPLKPTGADGHWECSMEAECLPRDGFIEFLN